MRASWGEGRRPGVVIGARVGAPARPGEILVSRTVQDLVVGSGGLTFEDAGGHELKGVPDRWHLYRVVSGQAQRTEKCPSQRVSSSNLPRARRVWPLGHSARSTHKER